MSSKIINMDCKNLPYLTHIEVGLFNININNVVYTRFINILSN